MKSLSFFHTNEIIKAIAGTPTTRTTMMIMINLIPNDPWYPEVEWSRNCKGSKIGGWNGRGGGRRIGKRTQSRVWERRRTWRRIGIGGH
jgi:hypothetical protein